MQAQTSADNNNNSHVIIPTEQENKQMWNTFAPVFSSGHTRSTNQAAFSLATHLHLYKDDVNDILEVGCGGGGGTELINMLKRKEAKFVATDLSDVFLEHGNYPSPKKKKTIKEGTEIPCFDSLNACL